MSRGQNFPSPVELANEIVLNVQNSAQSVILSCQSFSMAWENYESSFWTDNQMSKFLNKLSDAGIGTGAEDLYNQKDGKYRITSKHATLSMLKGIGDSELFRNKSAVNACRVVGYSVLYQLSLYYAAALDKAERTKKENPSKLALKDTISLMVEFGASLRRDDVIDAKSKLLPRKKGGAKRKDDTAPDQTSTTTVSSLSSEHQKFSSLMLSADDKLLELARDSSLMELEEKLDYAHLLKPDAKIVVTCNGSELNESMKIARCMSVTNPKIYLVDDKRTHPTLLDLSSSTLLLSNTDLSKAQFDGKSSIAQSLRTLTSFEGGLNLFADNEEDGWVNVIGYKDSLNG